MNNEISGTGALEFYNSSQWVPVCFTEVFDGRAADVACRQFGYPFATNFNSVSLPYDRSGIAITRSFCGGTNSDYLFNCVNFTNMNCQTQLNLICHTSKHNLNIFNKFVNEKPL